MGYVDRVRQQAARLAERPARQPGGRRGLAYPSMWSDGAPVGGLSVAEYGYGIGGAQRNIEQLEHDFTGYAAAGYKGNGIVFTCIAMRMRVFSQARFMFRRISNGQPGELFYDPRLEVLAHPTPNMVGAQLLKIMEVDDSVAGNSYTTLFDDQGNIGRRSLKGSQQFVARMRPDWTRIVIDAPSGDPFGLDARVMAYMYGKPGQGDPTILMPDEVAHWWSYPDPVARFRGMSWLTPIIREVQADTGGIIHKGQFFANAATPNIVIKFDKDTDPDDFDAFVTKFKEQYEGVRNAYKTLFIGGGGDPVPLSANFQQLEFAVTQAQGETRIAATAGVHPALAGLSEGLKGSALNAGNFGAARRVFVDSTIRDMWNTAAPAMEAPLCPAPQDGRAAGRTADLWYDDTNIPFLREDTKDEADAKAQQAVVAQTWVNAGWDAKAVVRYLMSGDLNELLNAHTGMLSVQLRPPGQGDTTNPSNANGAAGAGTNGHAQPALLGAANGGSGGN